MKPVVKLVMFVKKLYQNGWPYFQVPLLNGNWLGEEKKKGGKKRKGGGWRGLLQFCYREASLHSHNNHDKHFFNFQYDDN
jgi:hypothetical protein